MNFDINKCITVFLALFFTIDIVGALPMIVDLRRKVGFIQAEKTAIVSAGILILFTFFGENILQFIGVDIHSFAIAGALVLFFISVEMILGIQLHRNVSASSASIVPLAFPIIAGTGSMTSILSFRSIVGIPEILVAILCNIILVYFVLKSSIYLERKIGDSGLAVLRKIFGVILLAICVKIFTSNIGVMFQYSTS